MKKILIGLLIPAVVSCIFIISCSGGSSTATVYIDLGLGNRSSSVSNSMVTKASTTTAPSNITSLTLNISGDGMDTISKSYDSSDLPSIISLEVPAGKSRLFEVLAYTPSITYRGTATAILSGEDEVYIPITMSLYETKIIVPDFYNSRIVQIDDMSGTNWTTVSSEGVYPYDIDFDNQGRIYIANYGGTNDIIYRTDDIESSVEINHRPSTSDSCTAIAIDRDNNYIYYAYTYNESTGTLSLGSCVLDDFDGTANESITLPETPDFYSIYGLAVDNGILYVAGDYLDGNENEYSLIWSYDISSSKWTDHYLGTTAYEAAWDVMVKKDLVYAAILSTTENRIITLSTGLEYKTKLTTTAAGGSFYGPRRFLSQFSDKIYIADCNDTTSARLVSFENITGDNSRVYGSFGTGDDNFGLWGTGY